MPLTLSPFHSDGTASLTNGSSTMTGQGTSWSTAQLRQYDRVEGEAGNMATVESIDGNGTITLDRGWEGPSQSEAPYKIWRSPDSVRVQADLRALVKEIGDSGNIQALAGLNGSGGNKLPYLTGGGTMDTTALTSLARSFIGQSTASDMRDTLEIADAIGWNDGTGTRTAGNLNNLTGNGTWNINSSTGNSPVSFGAVIQLQRVSDRKSQIVFSIDANGDAIVHRRNLGSSGWSDFEQQPRGYALRQIDYLDSSGTYDVPSWARALRIRAVGAGGGGGGASRLTSSPANASGGGGAGGEAERLIESPNSSYSYSIGSGGSGGSGSSGGNGSDGGDTTIAGMTAGGGDGGSGASNNADVATQNGGAGGDASGGDLNRPGNHGLSGIKLSTTSRAAGDGGHSRFASGGRGATANSDQTDNRGASGSRGSGASGAISSLDDSSAGMSGGNGYIEIEVYG